MTVSLIGAVFVFIAIGSGLYAVSNIYSGSCPRKVGGCVADQGARPGAFWTSALIFLGSVAIVLIDRRRTGNREKVPNRI